ncbi:MAG: response regulator transcription factor [Prevotella sp.]|nr:response regulator transcription factor [Prevotella sp.]
MKPLTCIIVDDEPLAVKLLESYVSKTPDLSLVGSYTDSVEAIAAIKSLSVDLLFLDIQMPDLDGMELARMVPEQTKIVFTTAFKEYAFESYEVSALDFLLKPIRYNKFLVSVEKARKWKNTQSSIDDDALPNSLFVKVDGELRQILLNHIVYVCGMKDYVMFYLDDEPKPLIAHLTMKAVEGMLPTTHFMRVHRSYIIALDKIKKVDRNDCIYIGDEIIHVPESYIDYFKTFLEKRTMN